MKPYPLANDLREPIQRVALLRVPHFVVPDGTVPPPAQPADTCSRISTILALGD